MPPILRTVATEGGGIPELIAAIASHRVHLEATGDWGKRERARLEAELDSLVRSRLFARWREMVSLSQYTEILDRLAARRISPHQAVEALLDGGQQE
jgi:LAO/AO transport system kinase